MKRCFEQLWLTSKTEKSDPSRREGHEGPSLFLWQTLSSPPPQTNLNRHINKTSSQLKQSPTEAVSTLVTRGLRSSAPSFHFAKRIRIHPRFSRSSVSRPTFQVPKPAQPTHHLPVHSSIGERAESDPGLRMARGNGASGLSALYITTIMPQACPPPGPRFVPSSFFET